MQSQGHANTQTTNATGENTWDGLADMQWKLADKNPETGRKSAIESDHLIRKCLAAVDIPTISEALRTQLHRRHRDIVTARHQSSHNSLINQ
jgi:hypothetical protein